MTDFMPPPTGFYEATVMHARLMPKRHRFTYRVFSLWLDVDEAAGKRRLAPFFSAGRFNLLSFFNRDHGDRKNEPLRTHVETLLGRHGIDIDGGPIRLLCFPRMLGYVFNPLSVFYCYQPGGSLAAVIYEVTSTFGARHSYVVPVAPQQASDADCPLRHSRGKALFVSPFIDMDARYDFAIRPPRDKLSIGIKEYSPEGLLLTAALSGTYRPLTKWAPLVLFGRYPLMTLKIIGAIHFEAARLWLKGVRFLGRAHVPQSAGGLLDESSASVSPKTR